MNRQLFVLLALAPAPLCAQTTELASVSSTGGSPGGDAYMSRICADGSRVAYTSNAANLVAGYSGYQVYVRDLANGVNLIASVSTAGVGSDNVSNNASLSADGRYVAFDSSGTNLVAGDTNGVTDVFVRDTWLATTQRVSLGAGSAQVPQESLEPVISADGTFVAFASRADFGLANDGNMTGLDVFLKDLTTGAISRISASSAGAGGDGDSGMGIRGIAMTPDARYIAFASYSTNLVVGDTNGQADVFVHDRQLGTTIRVSVATGGGEVVAPFIGSTGAAISANGRFVAFHSIASQLSPLDTDGFLSDVYVHDVQLDVTTLVSEATGGPLEMSSLFPSISADGRYVAFQNGSGSGELWQIWIRDLQTGAAELVSQSTSGLAGDDDSSIPSISADGVRVVFHSNANNFWPNTGSGNTAVFLRSRPDYTSYCYGDGTGTPCPCGNQSAPGQGQGCMHSLGSGGELSGLGSSTATADSFVLIGSSLPDSFGLFFQGTSRVNGGLGVTFGDGLRCAGGSILRLRIKPITGGTARYPEAGDTPISVLAGLSPGDVRTYQIWYRNAAAFCTSATFNLTNAIEATW